MSIWDYIFDNEWRQRSDIESLRARSRSAQRMLRSQGREVRDRIEALEDQVGELALLCRSLLAILVESGGVDPERFEAVLDRIDLEDGVRDGKVTEARPQPEAPKPVLKKGRRRR